MRKLLSALLTIITVVCSGAYAQSTEMPDHYYLIGSFNNWMLPEGSSLNGALEFSPNEYLINQEPVIYFSLSCSMPQGDLEFAIAYQNQNGTFVKYGTDYPPFTLFNRKIRNEIRETGLNIFYTEIEPNNRINPIRVLSYSGYRLNIKLHPDTKSLSISSPDALVVETPDKLYAVIAPESGQPYTKLVYDNDAEYYLDNYLGGALSFLTNGKTDIIFSTEDTISPTPDQTWGVVNPSHVTGSDQTFAFQYVKNGYPITFSYKSANEIYSLNMTINMCTSIVEGKKTNFEFEDLQDNIYLIGYQTGWIIPVEDNETMFPKLHKTEEHVYEGDIDCPYKESEYPGDIPMCFRFYWKLAGWTNTYSIGSSEEDFYNEPLYMNNGYAMNKIIPRGLGCWALTDWSGGTLHMKLDLRNLSLIVTDKASVECVDNNDLNRPVNYYNMQGVKIDRPSKGVYIKKQGNKTTKVIF